MSRPGNPEPLKRVAEWLEAGAPHTTIQGATVLGFNMSEGVLAENTRVGCGTVCCIAGAIVQFEDPVIKDDQIKEQSSGLRYNPGYGVIFNTAQSLCGMTYQDATDLFEPYDHGRWDTISPETAARVIRHYLETGRVDWTQWVDHYEGDTV